MTSRCLDCEASPGEIHVSGCEEESCPRCGGQLLSCVCIYEVSGIDPARLPVDYPEVYRDGPTPEMEAAWDLAWSVRRIPWSGERHGTADCRAFGLWSVQRDAGCSPAAVGAPGAAPDLEALSLIGRWSADDQRFYLDRDVVGNDGGETFSPESTREVVMAGTDGRPSLSYGRLIRRRYAGGYSVRLALDLVRRSWWIVSSRTPVTTPYLSTHPPRLVTLGFSLDRRADAVGAFLEVSEADLDALATDGSAREHLFGVVDDPEEESDDGIPDGQGN